MTTNFLDNKVNGVTNSHSYLASIQIFFSDSSSPPASDVSVIILIVCQISLTAILGMFDIDIV